MNLEEHLKRQIAFSRGTFGPDERMEGVIEHIKQELEEIRQGGNDPNEWIDVVILAFDGLWRSLAHKKGLKSTSIIANEMRYMLEDKQDKNERRIWPDWRTIPSNQAINHTRGVND